MKLNLGEESNNPELEGSSSRNKLSLPEGLFGFSQIRSMELMFDEEELPFMWLREEKEDGLAFVVLELEDVHFVVVVSRAVLCDTLDIRNSILTENQAEEEPKNDCP